jgi:hypothetical protein
MVHMLFSPGRNLTFSSIIFVHGLFGHPEKTWTGHQSRSRSPPQPPSEQSSQVMTGGSIKNAEQHSDDVFWPADLLPDVVPNTRIWTWGYDADIDSLWSSASQNTVSQHATNLLSDVANLLESDKHILPVIFIAHSLGGIVVKAVRPLLVVFSYFLHNHLIHFLLDSVWLTGF